MFNQKFMQKAIDLSRQNIKTFHGGPFGAVIVRKDEIIAEGWNQVVQNNDPTAHAEVMAIRKACQVLKTYSLADCEIYTSCEPCPMCLSSIYWARIESIYYAGTREDAKKIGFDDSWIYDELKLDAPKRHIPMHQYMVYDAKKVYDEWMKQEERVFY